MKVSDYIIEFLVKHNIDKVFGYIGGNNAHIMDSIDNHENIEMVNAIHEQGAGFAAEGYARATGKIGVATATSGPGATNLITPIASCFYDSVPAIFITGQVNTYECKNASECENNAPVRQIGFQETDIVSVVKPITKYAVLIDNIHDLKYELEKAVYLSEEGRKGPVLIDIPIDLQYKDINFDEEKSFYGSEIHKESPIEKDMDDEIETIAKLINDAKRPVILVGGGARISDVELELNALLRKTNIPLVYTLMGKDIIKESYTYNLGFIGAYGNRCALPTAIGAVLGSGKRAIVIVGDGGFQMNIQELEVIKRRKLPIKIFIMNNAFLGMVRQMQTEFLNKNYIGTQNDYSVPNFKHIGDAYDIKSHEVSNMDDIENIIKVSLENDECELIDIQLSESKHLVEPRLAGNRPMEDMSPFLDREEFKKQMVIKPLDE